MLRGSKHRKAMNEINVVPYIDVMLVLLVIFMITAPLMNPGIVDLPSISKAGAPPTKPIEVTIKKNGRLSYIDRNISGAAKSVDRQELLNLIREKQKVNPDQTVVISADKDVRYKKVMQVMDLLQQSQVRRIGLLAVPKR